MYVWLSHSKTPFLLFCVSRSVPTTLFLQLRKITPWDETEMEQCHLLVTSSTSGHILTCIKHTEHMPWRTLEARTTFLFITGYLNKVHQVMQYHLMGLLIIMIWQWKKASLRKSLCSWPKTLEDFNSFRREYLTKTRIKAPGCASEFPGCTEIPSSQITAEACSIVKFLFCIFDILSRQRLVQYHLSYGFL